MPSRIITLLTDFGLSDPYVGIMKGVIAQVNPTLQVIDLTHQIPPQNIALARFALISAYPHFPAGTVHIAVVDPGVGGPRRAIALALGTELDHPKGFLIGPDNGIFSGLVDSTPVLAAVELSNSDYWRTSHPSSTFHGRDIFATVGAHLANGVPFAQLGEPISLPSLAKLDVSNYIQIEPLSDRLCRMTGRIQAVDHFGNLITNITEAAVVGQQWSAVVGKITVSSRSTYGDSQLGEVVALVGSHGWVEIAVNGASASDRLRLGVGDAIQVVIQTNRDSNQLEFKPVTDPIF
jgi:S-adenosyl-L-methionine hydrolase (adenosine-forming)